MEIYKITKARHNAENPDYKKVLKHRLLATYKEFKDIFSKKQNDTLTPPRDYNHQIKLIKDKKILGGKGSLYHIPLERLDLLKDTLHKHLNRGFIMPNKATYTLPVLFTPKLNGG